MTRTPAPSRRFAIAAIACHAAIAAWCILTCIERSGRSGNYYKFHNSPELFVYPTHDVAVWCGVIVLELAITAWVLLRSPSLAAAGLMLGLLSGLGFVLLLPFGMHAPPYFGFQLIFLLFSAVAGARGDPRVARLARERRTQAPTLGARDERPAKASLTAGHRSAARE